MKRNEKGFTLIELMVAIAIVAIIAIGATMSIFQVVEGTERSNNHMTAVRQVQNAGYWISSDAQMAQRVELDETEDTGFPLTLTWTDWDTSDKHQAVYTLENMSGSGLKKLRRNYSINESASGATFVAQYIDPDPAKTKCELTAGGTFGLPDADDAFAITGGAVADNGTITVTAGSISVTTTGTATYDTGTGVWTTPAASDTVIIAANEASTNGAWTSTATSATVAITEDADRDATVTGSVLVFTVTATVSLGSQIESETRVYKVAPRPDSE